MKVLLLNGSPNQKGCTFTALTAVAAELEKAGIETELIQVGKQPIRGCTACGGCGGKGCCVFGDDGVNAMLEKLQTADGLVVGSPVHYASASGAVTSFLDRLFYAGSGKLFAYKPGAAIVSARRGGTTAALDQLNKYFTISSMPVVSSQYWNMVHGSTPEQVLQDEEGMQVMRVLGRNMAWLLKSIEAGKQSGVPLPEREQRQWTNFIR